MKENKYFQAWFEKYEEELQTSECQRSYYDSDTGYWDAEGARYDELRAAFEAGVKSVKPVGEGTLRPPESPLRPDTD